MRSLRWAGIIVALLAFVSVAVWCTHRPGGGRNAVFLIIVDTLRADRLSSYGYGGHETTEFDALAARGVLFENAVAPASWTVPSMGSIMTGSYPGQLGLLEVPLGKGQNVAARERRDQIAYTIPLYSTTLAEVLRDAGFTTAGFVNQPALNNRDGFVQGFMDWFYPAGSDTVIRRDPASPLEDRRITRKRVTLWDDVDRTDAAIVESFVAWMETAPDGDLFVWLHLLSPHIPYRPPPGFAPDRNARSRDKKFVSRLYDGEVRYTDYLVGRVIEAIDEHIGLAQSIVVFTSDHGEEFEEHGMTEHGHSLHREVMHVPLILQSPELPAGTRVKSFVRLIDILPTILDITGNRDLIPDECEGESLLKLAMGSENDRVVYSEGVLYGPSERSLIENGLKLMWDQKDNKYTLYDLGSDRLELTDISGDHEADVVRMGSAIMNYSEKLAVDYRNRASAATVPDSLAAAEERERVLKAMKSLGYINE
jgi:arylsulfatase A-like enzyme